MKTADRATMARAVLSVPADEMLAHRGGVADQFSVASIIEGTDRADSFGSDSAGNRALGRRGRNAAPRGGWPGNAAASDAGGDRADGGGRRDLDSRACRERHRGLSWQRRHRGGQCRRLEYFQHDGDPRHLCGGPSLRHRRQHDQARVPGARAGHAPGDRGRPRRPDQSARRRVVSRNLRRVHRLPGPSRAPAGDLRRGERAQGGDHRIDACRKAAQALDLPNAAGPWRDAVGLRCAGHRRRRRPVRSPARALRAGDRSDDRLRRDRPAGGRRLDRLERPRAERHRDWQRDRLESVQHPRRARAFAGWSHRYRCSRSW